MNVHENDTQCDEWARDGECDYDNALWMLQYCALSCGHCPADPQALGECQLNAAMISMTVVVVTAHDRMTCYEKRCLTDLKTAHYAAV